MSRTLNSDRDGLVLGVSLIIATTFLISVQDVVFKLFSSEMTLWQIFALRGCLAVPVLATLAWMTQRDTSVLKAAFGKWPMLRAVCITGTFLAFYAALPFLSLSTVGAVNYTAPIFVAVLAAYVIKVPVGRLGWIGILVGFAGVVVLLRPGSEAFSPWSILPLFGAFLYALAHLITRAKCQEVPLSALSLAQNTMMLMAGWVITLALLLAPLGSDLAETTPYIFGAWSHVEPSDWLVLLVLAGFSILLGIMLAGAYKAAPPTVVATFEYSYLVFVLGWDFLLFDVAIGPTAVVGMILIVVAGLCVMRKGGAI